MKTKFKLSNRILSLVLAFVMVLGMMSMMSFTAFAADATDTACADSGCSGHYVNGFCSVCDGYEEPSFDGVTYIIVNAGNLYWFANYVNTVEGGGSSNAYLKADIVVNETVLDADGSLISDTSSLREWTPITYGDVSNYQGKFSGNGHSISGLYSRVSGKSTSTGLFEAIGGNAWISNLAILDSYFEADGADSYAGAFAAVSLGGNISGCYNGATVRASFAGGFVGFGGSLYAAGCINAGKVISSSSLADSYLGAAGGILGASQWVKADNLITSCANVGSVVSESSKVSYVGALVGMAEHSQIIDSYFDASKCADGTGALYSPSTGEFENVYISGVEAKTSAEFENGTVCRLLGAHSTKYVYTASKHSKVCRICDEVTQAEEYHNTNNFCDENPACTVCGFLVEEHAYVENICAICSAVCYSHTFGQDNKCTTCNFYLVAVQSIESNFSSSAIQGEEIELSATVLPSNASFSDIDWYVVRNGSEEAVENVATALEAGAMTIRAKVENGKGMGVPYVQDFTVSVEAVETEYDLADGYIIITQYESGKVQIEQRQFNGEEGCFTYDSILVSQKVVSESEPVLIKGSSARSFIEVQSGSPKLVFDSVSIQSTNPYQSPVSVLSGASADITLVGDSVLTAYRYFAGIYVSSGASVVIGGNGSLDVTGGSEGGGTGIGGDTYNNDPNRYSSGKITVNGGNITAISYGSAAAIGSSVSGDSEKIVINGGKVTATNYIYNAGSAAGIGSRVGNAGEIEINGGFVVATGGEDCPGIGCGGSYSAYGTAAKLTVTGGTVVALANGFAYGIGRSTYGNEGTTTVTGGNVYALGYEEYGNIYGSVTDGNGNALYLNTITLKGLEEDSTNYNVTGISSNVSYGLKDTVTYGGKLYLYLPDGSEVDSVTVGDIEYFGKLTDRAGTYCSVHTFENGFCVDCGTVQHPELVNGYYEIENADQFLWFAELVNGGNKTANAVLTDDIDMTGIEWTPICSTGLYCNTTTYTDKGYEGTFDGGGYMISNLKITGTDGVKASYGLFGTLSGTVKNLGMRGMTFSYADTYDTITTDARAGAIAGQMLDGSLISDCFVVDSSLTPNNYIVGGIAGCNYAGTIQNCYTKNVTISAHSRCGNLVSDTRGDISTTDRPGTVKNCYTDASRVVGTNTSGSEYITGCVANILDRIFASGRITYQLNGGISYGLWKLNASGLPAFVGETVYQNTCGGDIFYSTTNGDFDSHIFDDETLLCTNCGSYEAAILVTAENYSDLGLDESYVGYYAIKNASNLYWYSERERIGDISGSIVLLNDITLDNSVAEWIPIGWDGDCTFDGRGNTITLKLNYGTEQDSASYGLFGTCNYCVVKNLFLDGYLTVNTTGNVGAVAASMYRTTISSVISTVNVTNTCTTGGNVGGLVGYFGGQHDTTNNQYSKIENSAVYADVTGYNAGGLIGQSWNGTQYYDITNAAYVGNVTTTDTVNGMAGAIVGYQATDSNTCTFTNVYWCEDDVLGFYGKRDTENQVYTNTEAKTADQFASGEVTWLLNGESPDGIWKQTIGLHDYPVFEGATVNLNGTTYENTGNYIYVEITWTAMEFTYISGDWNPETHQYDVGYWWRPVANNGEVHVTNKGSAVYVSFGYTSLVDGVSGYLDLPSDCLEKDESCTSNLTLEGKPTGGSFTDQQIGSITVTISQTPPASFTRWWEVGDTVEHIGKNGKVYSCYIADERDGKYVLLTKEPEIFDTMDAEQLEALKETQLQAVGATRYPAFDSSKAEYAKYESYALESLSASNDYEQYISLAVNSAGEYVWLWKDNTDLVVILEDISIYYENYNIVVCFYYIFEVPVS